MLTNDEAVLPVTEAAESVGESTDVVAASELGSAFELDVRLLEVADPGYLINMTDDGCGSTCEKATCITAS